MTNADCPDPAGPVGPICGGRRCDGGINDGVPCNSNSECTAGGGICTRAGEPTKPNGCLDDTSTPVDGSVCADTAPVGDNEGACPDGPIAMSCTNHSQRRLRLDADCDNVVGTCVQAHRPCFLDNGVIGGAIVAAGMTDNAGCRPLHADSGGSLLYAGDGLQLDQQRARRPRSRPRDATRPRRLSSVVAQESTMRVARKVALGAATVMALIAYAVSGDAYLESDGRPVRVGQGPNGGQGAAAYTKCHAKNAADADAAKFDLCGDRASHIIQKGFAKEETPVHDVSHPTLGRCSAWPRPARPASTPWSVSPARPGLPSRGTATGHP